MSEQIGKECLASMNELNMCQPRVGGMCHLTNYSIFSTLTFFICFQSGDEPYVCEAAKNKLPVVAFPLAFHGFSLQTEGLKILQQLAVECWPVCCSHGVEFLCVEYI